MKVSERIGVILVHGIGEQRRFEHLSNEVRQLIIALEANPNIKTSVQTGVTRDSELFAEHETWRAEEQAPVQIDICRVNGSEGDVKEESRKTLHVHEVWWADLDDKETLWNRFKFWFWALGMWGAKRYTRSGRGVAVSEMKPPVLPRLPGGEKSRELLERARLFLFGIAFFLSATTIDVLNFLIKRFGFKPLPGANVFYRFLGDVKLYQDRGREGEGPLTDIGLPRRIAIRRRMVAALVAAYREKYDRWYVLAHSLGSVIALNGLMETAHALPNYLPFSVWSQLIGDPVLSRHPSIKPPVKDMWPARPLWIANDRAILDRRTLFSRLHGLVTYGSPLDKYALFWPQIVNVNRDNTVFADNFGWINVFDHTDPVGSEIKAFPDAFGKKRPPVNLAYKAHWLLLFSHLRYLHFKKRKSASDLFSSRLLDWMLDGTVKFRKPDVKDFNWYPIETATQRVLRQRWLSRSFMWVVVPFSLAALIGCLGIPTLAAAIDSAIGGLASLIEHCCGLVESRDAARWLEARYKLLLESIPLGGVGFVLLSTALLVLIAGLLRALVERRIDRVA